MNYGTCKENSVSPKHFQLSPPGPINTHPPSFLESATSWYSTSKAKNGGLLSKMLRPTSFASSAHRCSLLIVDFEPKDALAQTSTEKTSTTEHNLTINSKQRNPPPTTLFSYPQHPPSHPEISELIPRPNANSNANVKAKPAEWNINAVKTQQHHRTSHWWKLFLWYENRSKWGGIYTISSLELESWRARKKAKGGWSSIPSIPIHLNTEPSLSGRNSLPHSKQWSNARQHALVWINQLSYPAGFEQPSI